MRDKSGGSPDGVFFFFSSFFFVCVRRLGQTDEVRELEGEGRKTAKRRKDLWFDASISASPPFFVRNTAHPHSLGRKKNSPDARSDK